MRRPDDCSLTPMQLARVRAEAERALREAGALGVFPTPVEAIMTVAKVKEVKEDVLNLHSPSGVSFEVKIACIRALDKDFLPQAAPAVAQTAGSGRIRPRSRCFLAQGRRFSAQRTDLSSRFRSV